MRLIYDVALSLVGTPYKWGGATPMEGLDCSGLVQILLAVGGADPPGDQTAQSLYDYFLKEENHASREPRLGSLAFFGSSPYKVIHVAMCLDKRKMIEAGGGDSSTITLQEAIKKRACVRIVSIPIKNLLGFYLPDYPCAIKID